MDDLSAYLIESVLITLWALILLGFSIRQVSYDILQQERWRPLIVSHCLTFVFVLIFVVTSVDGQGGLGIYSNSGILLANNVKGVFTIASAQALAASFVESHKLVTQGPSGPRTMHILLVAHGIFLLFAISYFVALAVTRDTLLAVGARCMTSIYSIVVGVQVFHGAFKVRQILVDEHKRASKYADGIRKLTRVLVGVVIVVVLGNIGNVLAISSDLKVAASQKELSQDRRPYDSSHLVGVIGSVLAPSLLLMGAWSARRQKSAVSRKSATTTRIEREITQTSVESSPSPTAATPEQSKREIMVGTSEVRGSEIVVERNQEIALVVIGKEDSALPEEN